MFIPPYPLLPKGAPDDDWLKKWDRGFAILKRAYVAMCILFVASIAYISLTK